ncbi:hypothetical protein [Arthrobacter sp. MMS18-M83]|uniref:hypothetical protein n=1 Tax=Arthrobacter sp. MMS18-M83 TaxID=2996261 RepID=UPI00227CEF99|nr:hypothetical protein [Arthrobacter sp. MMS18-M83]WAH95658.1 hypothetical protein OW521_14515 [Arthrobacter sp. MMS18-M83]
MDSADPSQYGLPEDGAAATRRLDFFYGDADGQFSAAQALYDVNQPFTQKAVHRGGSLAWGGLLRFGGT